MSLLAQMDQKIAANGGLIVSCQPVPDSPLDKPEIVAAMALAAEQAGAVAIRIEGVANLQATRAVVSVPIIGIVKRDLEDSPVRITAYIEDVDALAQAGADILHVGGLPHKGGGDEVGLHFAGEGDVRLVPVAHEGHGQRGAGNVNPFIGGNKAAVDHGAGDFGFGGFLNLQVDQAVIDEDMASPAHIRRQPGKADGSDAVVPLHRLGGEDEQLAGPKLHPRLLKGAETDFRPLGIDQYGHGKLQLLSELFHHLDAPAMAVVILMRHIDTGHVHSRQHELAQHGGVVGGGPEGADDFGFPHKKAPAFLLKGISESSLVYTITYGVVKKKTTGKISFFA